MSLVVPVPGSKSMTQRALIMAALAGRPLRIGGALSCDDSLRLSELLSALGTGVAWEGEDVAVTPRPLRSDGRPLFCGNGGTTLRFGSCLSLVTEGALVLDGDERMRERPFGPLGEALARLGVAVEYLRRTGFPPVRLRRAGPAGETVTVDASLSSQFASGLLLVAPALPGPLEVRLGGDPVSSPYLDMTAKMMRRAGAHAERREGFGYRVDGGAYGAEGTPGIIEVEPDWSSAALVLAAGFVAGRDVRVPGLPPRGASLQGDAAFGDMLERLALGGYQDFDLTATPDLVAPLAACALFGRGPVNIRGARHTRLKESDRLAVLAAAFRRLGASVEEHPDGLRLEPLPETSPRELVLDDGGDHRMAMAFGVLSLRLPGIRPANPHCVAKSFPLFWEALERIRRGVEPFGPVLVGLRGAGKTEVGRRAAGLAGLRFVDADEELERRAGQDIPALFRKYGEAGFREREEALLRELLAERGTLLATGGGAVLHPAVRQALSRRFTVWLHADLHTLAGRVRGSARPSLTGAPPDQELAAVFAERELFYRNCASLMVDTGRTGPEAAAERICREWAWEAGQGERPSGGNERP